MAPVALGTLGTGTENIMDRAVKELKDKFRHVVIYTDQASGEHKIHVPNPDHWDLNEEQQEAYANLVSTHGIHEIVEEDGKDRTTPPKNPPGTTPNTEPTETSYLALTELTKAWDVVPAPVLEHAEPSASRVCMYVYIYIYMYVAE